MRLNSKVTWGLAWTGLAVVLAVPSVDFLTGQFAGKDAAAVLTSDVEPVKTAAITPADPLPVKTVTTVKTKNGISIVPAGSKLPAADPVEANLNGGKKLPDYISDGDSPAKTETQVASIDPTPPTPFPSWARPKVAAEPAAPVLTTPATTTKPAITTAPATATTPEPIVLVDERTLTGSIAAPAEPLPPAAIVDDSENWDTETLRQYLERRGILEGGDDGRSSARVTERSTTYDPDGFYLNEGPNGDRTTRETRRDRVLRMLEESDDGSGDFTLF
jgi:hypothetical protein